MEIIACDVSVYLCLNITQVNIKGTLYHAVLHVYLNDDAQLYSMAYEMRDLHALHALRKGSLGKCDMRKHYVMLNKLLSGSSQFIIVCCVW